MEGSDNKKEKVVMVAFDDSDCSHHALLRALQNLRPIIAESRFLVLSVQSLDGFGYVYTASIGQAPPELIQNLEENRRTVALALLEKVKSICSDHRVITLIMCAEIRVSRLSMSMTSSLCWAATVPDPFQGLTMDDNLDYSCPKRIDPFLIVVLGISGECEQLLRT